MTPFAPTLWVFGGLMALLVGLRVWTRRGLAPWLLGVVLVGWGVDGVRVLFWLAQESRRPWLGPVVLALAAVLVVRTFIGAGRAGGKAFGRANGFPPTPAAADGPGGTGEV